MLVYSVCCWTLLSHLILVTLVRRGWLRRLCTPALSVTSGTPLRSCRKANSCARSVVLHIQLSSVHTADQSFNKKAKQILSARSVHRMSNSLELQNPASTVILLQHLLGPSVSDVPTQRRNMVLPKLVSSANNSVLLIVKRKAGERWMVSCSAGCVRCHTDVSCKRLRSKGKVSARPILLPSMRKTTTPDHIIITTITNTDTAAPTTN